MAVPLITFSVVATFRLCVDGRDGLQRKRWEGVYYLESLSLPTRAATMVAELSDLAPQVFLESATALLASLSL